MRGINLPWSDVRLKGGQWRSKGCLGLIGCWVALSGCQLLPADKKPTIEVTLAQKWELQPGDRIAGFLVTGGLGDISIDLNGRPVYAPFAGEAKINPQGGCVFFDTAEVPAYLFRFCGLQSPRLGPLNEGESFGKANTLQFAALRRQPDGTWAMVEPAKNILERSLKAP